MADIVELILEMRNVAQFVSGARQASTAAGDIGTKTEEAGKKAGAGWKGLAKWAGGAAALYGATRYVKGAVSATEDLAKATITVSRTTGMDTETSSEWAALMKERGVSTKQFQTSLVKLSKTMEASRTGTVKENATIKSLREQIDAVSAAGGKKAPAQLNKLANAIARAQAAGVKARSTLAQLGVSQADVAKGNTADVLYKVADALERMRSPTQRAALLQQLFGRSGQALLPILMKGRAGVRKLLEEQKAAGNYISGKGIKSAKDLVAQQRALETALSGVKVQLGQALLPVLVQVGKILVRIMTIMRPLTKNALAFKIAIFALATAFVAYKVAMIAATIATTVFDTAAAPVVGIVLGVIAAVALLTIGIYELWKHCKWFRDGVREAWAAAKTAFAAILDAVKAVVSWVKNNWQYVLAGALGGPFALAAVAIIKHFGDIKRFALGVVDDIKAAIQRLVDWVESLPSRLGNTLRKIPGVGTALKVGGGAAHAIGSVFHRQHGGPVPAGGMALVGERGPELVRARTALTITPVVLNAELAGAGGHARPLEIVIPVMLDGREIARSTARVAADQLARR